MHIRPLAPSDGAAFRLLRLEALRLHPEAFGASFVEASRTDAAGFAARLAAARPPDAVFGAFDGDELAGMAGFAVRDGEKSRHKGLLWGVYVRADRRGRTFGRALVEHVIAHARSHVAALQATVVTTNTGAVALYRSLGFETYGVERDALRVEGRSFDEALIELRFDGGRAA